MELIEIDVLFPIYAWFLLAKLLFYLNELSELNELNK